MKAVTLYGQDRFSLLSALPEPHLDRIRQCLKDTHGITELDTDNLTAWDIERYLDINYVDKNRDLSSVHPIDKKDYFIFHNRENFQPLLEALEKGDFELAEALTPEKYRLCGYTELKETTRVEEYGNGWAGQFAHTDVPAGIYPIFCREFAYHERDKHFTNEVHYRGVFEWFEGTCVASSDVYFKDPEPNVVIKSPYAYELANNVDKGVGTRHLIYPFKPVSTVHESGVDGKPFVHYTIVDTTVPYKAEGNPLYLRGCCSPQNLTKPSLSDKIRQAEEVKAEKSVYGHEPSRTDKFIER